MRRQLYDITLDVRWVNEFSYVEVRSESLIEILRITDVRDDENLSAEQPNNFDKDQFRYTVHVGFRVEGNHEYRNHAGRQDES